MPSSIRRLRGWLCAGLLAVIPVAGCSSDGGGATPADTTQADVDEGLGIDYSATSGGPVARYEPGSGDFTGTPWPSDRDRSADGTVDLTRFPNPQDITLVEHYLTYGGEVLDGFSRNGAVYFELSALIDVDSLPDDETSMNDPRATAQLVNVSPASATYGRRLPLVFQATDDPDDDYYMGPTLAMRAVYGFPLADAETYCAILTRAVTDAAGNYVEPAPAFHDALETEPALAPLRDWLADSPLAPHDIAAATCFTTQDATKGMRDIERTLSTLDTPALSDIVYKGATTHSHQLTAMYGGVNFQSGVKPYTQVGGGMVLGDDGLPVPQDAAEPIRVRILIPRNATMPESGWPVVLYSHGTGGNWETCLSATDTVIAQEGLAMLCIDQPLHGIRGVGDDDNFLNSFNFLNPESGRMSFRQAAADTLWLTRMITDGRFDLSASSSEFTDDIKLDPARIVLFGHSHGGLAGVLLLGTDPRIKGAVLSGASGILVETILRRKDPVNIKQLVATATQVELAALDTFHPVMTLAQTLVDATDPVNYAPYWLSPVTGGNSKHVFMTEGRLDDASPTGGADAVAAAAGIPLIEPVAATSRAHELRGLAPVKMPVSQNLSSNTGQIVTAGIRQFLEGDHFVAFRDETARQLWRGFIRAFKTGDAPVIAPP